MTEQLIIEHDGHQVTLTLNLADNYAAIEIYEKLLVQARNGFVLLDVETMTKDEPLTALRRVP